MQQVQIDSSSSLETLQSCKIQLMQKQRIILTLQSKLKKIQFKTSRDVKEHKMGEEKLRLQLKEEQLKLQKMTKLYADVVEAIASNQREFNQLIQQKQTELQTCRLQYQNLRAEHMQYQRILPSHTFLVEYNKNYQQLKTYQQLFYSNRDLVGLNQQLQGNLAKLKKQTSQEIQLKNRMYESVEMKRVQIQSQLRISLSKQFSHEQEILRLKQQLNQCQQQVSQLQNQLQQSQSTCSQLQDQNKSLSQKINQIVKLYQSTLEQKEQYYAKCFEEEQQQHQEQVDNITKKFMNKEADYDQRCKYFQQENQRLNDQIQADKMYYIQMYKSNIAEIEKLKAQLEASKHANTVLQDNLGSITQHSHTQTQKIKQLQNTAANLTKSMQTLEKTLQVQHSQSTKKLNSVVEEKKSLEEKIVELHNQTVEMKGDLMFREGEIAGLQQEVEELRSKGQLGSSYSISPLPSLLEVQKEQILQARRSRSKTQDFFPPQPLKNQKPNQSENETTQMPPKQNAAHAISLKYLQTQISEQMLIAKQQIESQIRAEYQNKLAQVEMKYESELCRLMKGQMELQTKIQVTEEQNRRQKISQAKQLHIKDSQIITLNKLILKKSQQIQKLAKQLKQKDQQLQKIKSQPVCDHNEQKTQLFHQLEQKSVELSNLKQQTTKLRYQIQEQQKRHQIQINSVKKENNQFIQEIIRMKFEVANARSQADQQMQMLRAAKKKMGVL